MPDVYATIADQSAEIQKRLADANETRAAEPRQLEMLAEYLRELKLPPAAAVLDVGCGTGVLTRLMQRQLAAAEMVGLDPSPHFIERARENADGASSLRFEVGDARLLPFDGARFDGVIFHTVLCHVPEREAALAEAFRVLKPGGLLAVFDGDYATTSVATGEHDPLQVCADAEVAALVDDRWLVKRLPALVRKAGFELAGLRSHGYVQSSDPAYMFMVIDRGCDFLVEQGRIGEELAAALKAEARRRERAGEFFGQIAYASVIARKP